MIYLMNSAVMPAGNYGEYTYSEASLEDLGKLLRGEYGEYRSHLGYPQNADLIEQWTGIRPEISRTETRFKPGEAALVMRLKTREVNLNTKGALVSDAPEDWEFAWVTFSK